MADPETIVVTVPAGPSEIEVTMVDDPLVVTVQVPGQQGPKGDPGTYDGEELPDLSLLFENQLV